MNKLLQAISENAAYFVQFLLIIVLVFIAAIVFEKIADKRAGRHDKILTTRKTVCIGVFSALAAILYILDFPVFFAPAFYKMDFSELPALIGGFAFGPVAGVMIEFIKQLVKLAIKGTSTAFVGDLANFVIGTSFVLVASIIYRFKKNRHSALISCIAGTLAITVVGTCFNAVYLLPAFAKLYGMPLDAIIGMGTAIFPSVHDITSFVILCVAPLNLLKGTLISLITFLIYKRISPILKNSHNA